MKSLEYYRAQIDKIDTELIRLIEERMDVAKQIGRVKLESGMSVLDEKREKAVLASRMDKVQSPQYEGVIEEFFLKVMELSREVQQRIMDSQQMKKTLSGRACYQGVDGAYGSMAAEKVFGENIYNVKTFENVIEEVIDGKCDYGVLPLENSTTGTIDEVLDLLKTYPVFIVGETFIKVKHNLLAKKGMTKDDIKEVYSHEQGFFQCREYLKDKPWTLTSVVNTAVGASLAAESSDNTKAAIASARAAKLYDLDILESSVNHGKNNVTRFAVISRTPVIGEGAVKAAVLFSVPHVSGALVSALEIMAKNGVNLVKLESRPVIDRIGEYIFYAELEGNINDENMQKALKQLQKYATDYKYLGNFKKI